jgi:Oxidoreductase molybdopterin binding domain
MPVRNLALLLCLFCHLGFCQSPARIFVAGIGIGKSGDFAPSNSELALLQQRTNRAIDHGTPVTFQGVLLTDVLANVATPTGEKFHSTAASYYLVAEGRDGYRAVFAWTELDPSFQDKAVYVVTKRNGKPLSDDDGPFELVVPGEKGNARWVRQLSALRVEPNETPYGSEQARWIQEVLPELESIKVGMTRGELLKVFMEEGGISGRTRHRYVYRKCGLVKVDVEFAPASEKDNDIRDRPDDRITKISKPYLDYVIID